MSVLNRMLRDLENRGVAPDSAVSATRPPSAASTPGLRPMPPPPGPEALRGTHVIRLAVWAGLAAATLATGAAYLWYENQLNADARAPQPLGMQQYAAVAAPPAAPVATTPLDSPAMAVAPRATDSAVHADVAAPAHTTPAMPAAPVPAMRMTVALAAPPSHRVETAAFARKAATIPVPRSDRPQLQTEPGAPTPQAKTFINGEATAAAASSAASASATPSAVGTPTAKASAAAEAISIVTAPAHPGSALQARAAELVARGRSVEAMALLIQLLLQAPDSSDARATLAALQAEAGRRDLALQTLLAGSRIDPSRFTEIAARLQADLGDPHAALATLERVPEAARSAHYDALVGGIAHRAGEHAHAVDAYRRALRMASAPPIWWAGLAIALEASNQPAPALDAFRRAAADPSLPAIARSFALTRIGALSAEATAPQSAADGTLAKARR